MGTVDSVNTIFNLSAPAWRISFGSLSPVSWTKTVTMTMTIFGPGSHEAPFFLPTRWTCNYRLNIGKLMFSQCC